MTDRCYAGLGGVLGADDGDGVADAGELVAALAGSDGGIEFGERPADGGTVGVSVADATEPHQPLVYVSEGFERLTGHTAVEAVGRSRHLLAGRDTDSGAIATLRDAAGEGRTATVELRAERADGTAFVDEVTAIPVTDGTGAVTRVLDVHRDVTEQRRYEAALTELHERAGEVTGGGDRGTVVRTAVEAVDALVGLDGAAFYEFDGRDALEPVARSPTGENPDDLPSVGRGGGVLWTAFAEDEQRFVESGEACRELSLGSVFAVPVGTHGVLIAGASDAASVTPARREACRLLAANLSAALDRLDRERELRERDRRLDGLEERVERLDRLNGLLRQVNRLLARAPSEEEVAASVPERVAAAEGYAFAWLGSYDPEGSVTLQEWAGVDREYADRLRAADDDGPLGELVAAAAQTGTVQVASSVLDAPGWAAHRADALDGGYRSVAAVPVGDRTDRVLVVHGRDGGTFDEPERAVLGELGRAVGQALDRAGRTAAIRTDERTEVELSVADDRLVTNRLAAELGAGAEYVGAIPAEGRTLRAFFRVDGAPPDAADRLAGLEPVDGVQPLAVEEGDGLYQLVLAVPPLLDALRRHDASLRALSTADGTTRVTAVVPGGADVRALVEDVASVYDGTELRARRGDAEPVDSRETFREELLGRLTEKQRDALQTALYGGFYEWPRASTGEELAATRDIAASTFQHHLRAAERKLVSAVLDPAGL